MNENTENKLSEDKQKAEKYLKELRKKLELAKKQQFTFLLIGRTGVGKSSTVNSLMGKEVARVGDWEATTMEIEKFENEAFGVKYTVIDTPGLCDDLEEKGNDEVYLKKIQSSVEKIDCLWFVTKLDETRVSSDEKRGIKLIAEAFGKKIWNNSIIVFTFANSIRPNIPFNVALEKRTNLIRKEIEKFSTSAIAKNIPSVAVDNTSETLQNGNLWLGELYTTVLERMSKDGVAPYLMALGEEISFPTTVPQHQSNSNSTNNSSNDSSRSNNNYSNKSWNDSRKSSNNNQNTYSSYLNKSSNNGQDRTGNNSSNSSSARTNKNQYQAQQSKRIKLNKDQARRVAKTIDASVIPGAAIVGASIGSAFGPAGAAVGGAIGFVVGCIAWWGK